MFSRRDVFILFSLGLIQFNHTVDFMILMPLGANIMKDFNINPAQFGLLISAYTFSAACVGFVAALYLDVFERKKALVFMNLGFALGTLGCAIAPSYTWLLVARAVAGAFGGTLASLIFAIIGDAFRAEVRGRATGTVMTSFSVASIAGVPLSILVAAHSTWHMPFYVLGFMALIFTAFIHFYFPSFSGHLEDSAAKKYLRQRLRITWELVSDRGTLLPLCFAFIVVFSNFLVIPFISPAFVANVGMRNEDLGIIYMSGGLTTIFTSPAFGKLSDRWGSRRVLSWTLPLSAPIFIIITRLGHIPIAYIVLVSVFFFMASNAKYVPTMSYLTGQVEPQRRGSYMSLVSMGQQLGAAAGAAIAGLLVVNGPSGELLNFSQVGMLSVAMTGVAFLMLRSLQASNRKAVV